MQVLSIDYLVFSKIRKAPFSRDFIKRHSEEDPSYGLQSFYCSKAYCFTNEQDTFAADYLIVRAGNRVTPDRVH